MERSDLHIHYSPVSYEESVVSAQDAIDEANRANVRAVALLARSQVVSHFGEFIQYGRSQNVTVIPGIEHLTVLGDLNVDVICLGFDYDHESITRYFGSGERRKLVQIAGLQKGFLESQGFSVEGVSLEDQGLLRAILQGSVVEKAIHLCEIVGSIEHNQVLFDKIKKENRALWNRVKNQYFDMPNYKGNLRRQHGKFLYQLFFDIGMSGYNLIMKNVDEVGSVQKVLEVVHQAGGVVLYSPEGNFREDIWQELRKLGIDGIMAWHGGRLGFNMENRDIPCGTIKCAIRDKLLILGGSDYQQKDWLVGSGDGRLQMSMRRSKDLFDYLKIKNNGKIPWERNY